MSLWLWIGLPLLFLLGLFLNAIKDMKQLGSCPNTGTRSATSGTTRTTDPFAGARRRSCIPTRPGADTGLRHLVLPLNPAPIAPFYPSPPRTPDRGRRLKTTLKT